MYKETYDTSFVDTSFKVIIETIKYTNTGNCSVKTMTLQNARVPYGLTEKDRVSCRSN